MYSNLKWYILALVINSSVCLFIEKWYPYLFTETTIKQQVNGIEPVGYIYYAGYDYIFSIYMLINIIVLCYVCNIVYQVKFNKK